MDGPGAPDDLTLGHTTQSWLAVSDDPDARVSGYYWYHREQRKPAPETLESDFQDRVMSALARLTGVAPMP